MKQSTTAVALALLVAITVGVLPAATADSVRPSKYTNQENVTTDFIKNVGTFSVTVYKLAHMKTMYYVRTLQCWSVPAGGGVYEYWMVLTAKNGAGAQTNYVSTVRDIPGSESRTWKLLSFNNTN